jgi:hypothetical protein
MDSAHADSLRLSTCESLATINQQNRSDREVTDGQEDAGARDVALDDRCG